MTDPGNTTVEHAEFPSQMDVPVARAPQLVSPVGARLGIVLVNYKQAAHTIECLESILRSDVPIHVVVVENGSADGSMERLVEWANGTMPYTPPEGPLGHYTSPPLPKPIAFRELDKETALSKAPGPHALTLIDSGANLGFAGGNNIGIRHLLLDDTIDYIWLLNNDTIAVPGFADAILRIFDSDPLMGMAGTVVRYYHRPDTVQVLNGQTFNVLTGQGKGIHNNLPINKPFDAKKVARDTDFVLGASLAVSRAFVEAVGLMSEDYFLYYEEIDWATRNQNRFRIGFARGATVYHKEGGSIGSSGTKGQRSALSDHYMLASRLKFYRAHYPALLPAIWLQGAAQTLRRLVRLQPAKARAMAKALFARRY